MTSRALRQLLFGAKPARWAVTINMHRASEPGSSYTRHCSATIKLALLMMRPELCDLLGPSGFTAAEMTKKIWGLLGRRAEDGRRV